MRKNVALKISNFNLQISGNCDQVCSNTNGSFTCSCVPGYQVEISLSVFLQLLQKARPFHQGKLFSEVLKQSSFFRTVDKTFGLWFQLSNDGHGCKAINVPDTEPASIIFANSVDIQHILTDGRPGTPFFSFISFISTQLQQVLGYDTNWRFNKRT